MSMSDAVVGQLMNNIINHPQDCDCISMESVRQGLATDLACKDHAMLGDILLVFSERPHARWAY